MGICLLGKDPVHAFNPAELLALVLYSNKEFPRLAPSCAWGLGGNQSEIFAVLVPPRAAPLGTRCAVSPPPYIFMLLQFLAQDPQGFLLLSLPAVAFLCWALQLCSAPAPPPPPITFASLLVSPLPGGAQRAERFASTRLPPRLALLPRGFRLI